MRRQIRKKTIRNLNLDHPGGLTSSFPPGMVKIQIHDGFHPDLSPHFSPGWSIFGLNSLKMLASIFEADGTTWYRRIELSWFK